MAPQMPDSRIKESEIVQKAENVLNQNWTGSFTKPAPGLYPHQWSWDAAFIAIGEVHHNQERAQQELRHLFRGQWKNGMIPHIVFNENGEKGSYFPGPDFWQAELSPNAPGQPKTSGICQPPLHATAVCHILEYAEDDKSALEFADELFPKLTSWHNFLYRERDPGDEGLVYIRHPWESGQDNSPVFDSIFDNLELDPNQIPDYERKDTKYIDESERPTDANYDRYIYLVDQFRKQNYDEEKIRLNGCPVKTQDVLFNTLLCRAGNDLAEIAELLGNNPSLFRNQARQTAQAMNNKLWDNDHGIYLDFDLNKGVPIDSHELSGFLPLFAGIPGKKAAEKLFDYLNSTDFCRLHDNCMAVPSFDRQESGFSPTDYWRGPIWINLNWMLREGLVQYGHQDYARKIKNTIFELVKADGFHEYYDPDTGDGYGSDRFSWSASLFLDIYHNAK